MSVRRRRKKGGDMGERQEGGKNEMAFIGKQIMTLWGERERERGKKVLVGGEGAESAV